MLATVSLFTNKQIIYSVFKDVFTWRGGGDHFVLPQEGSQASRLRLISWKDEEEKAEVPDAGDWKTQTTIV